ncbi:MAG: hypothetical protein NTY15_11910 [Planctomycetota bacterium]|nr:hypothetical protein [Planctomycetota bacterium]
MSISSAAASATIQQQPVARNEFSKKGFRGDTGQQPFQLRLVTGIDSGGLGGNARRFSGDSGGYKFASQMLLQHWNSSTEHGSNGAHNPLDSPPSTDLQSNGFECWA